MADILGVNVNLPNLDISGALSGSWIYILIVGMIGLIIVGVIAVLLFINTYSRKVVFFENISGQGFQPVIKTRARIIKLGRSGEEVLKTLKGGIFLSAYGRKMGKNTYWYAKGSDGYWYNILLGDLDAKFGILDIEPVDRDVRMFHLGVDKIAERDYAEKKSFMEKYGVQMMVLVFLVIFLVGLFVISGKISEGLMAMSNPETARMNQETAELLNTISNKVDTINRGIDRGEPIADSGLVPANPTPE